MPVSPGGQSPAKNLSVHDEFFETSVPQMKWWEESEWQQACHPEAALSREGPYEA